MRVSEGVSYQIAAALPFVAIAPMNAFASLRLSRSSKGSDGELDTGFEAVAQAGADMIGTSTVHTAARKRSVAAIDSDAGVCELPPTMTGAVSVSVIQSAPDSVQTIVKG